MRHGMSYRKLGRTSGHRAALFRNQLSSLIEHERIVTTLPKAKELRPLIEKMITLAKEDSVHNRRQAARSVEDGELVSRLFETLSPRFRERPGGYTRIIKLGPRRGDGAEMAIIEFVDYELKTPALETPKGRKKAAPKKEAAETEEGEEPEETEEKPKKKAAPRKAAPKKKPAKTSSAKKGAPRKGGTKGGKRGS